jgi:hypothetical protein
VLFFEALTEKARLISSSSLVNAPLRCGPLFRLRGRRGLMLRRRTAQAPSSRFALSQSLPALITTVLIRVRHGVQHTVAGPDAQWRKSNARYLSRRAALDPQLPFATIDSNAGLCPVAVICDWQAPRPVADASTDTLRRSAFSARGSR